MDWSKVTVPANVKVTDERASANGYPAEAGSVLRGRVVNLTTAKPVANARVLLTSWSQERQAYDEVTSATSGADGKFEVTRVPPGGSYRLHVEAPEHAPRLIGYESFGKDTLKQFPDVRIATAATFAGKVVTTDGKPVAGVKVYPTDVVTPDGVGYSAPAEASVLTDPTGSFAFTSLPAGTCRLVVQAPAYHAIEPLKRHTIPSDAIEFRMAATGNVHGKVTVNGGAPDAPFMASIKPETGEKIGSWSGSSNLKADGTFEFNGVPPGKYLVTARPNPGPVLKGKDPNEKAIEVKAGETLEVEIVVR